MQRAARTRRDQNKQKAGRHKEKLIETLRNRIDGTRPLHRPTFRINFVYWTQSQRWTPEGVFNNITGDDNRKLNPYVISISSPLQHATDTGATRESNVTNHRSVNRHTRAIWCSYEILISELSNFVARISVVGPAVWRVLFGPRSTTDCRRSASRLAPTPVFFFLTGQHPLVMRRGLILFNYLSVLFYSVYDSKN